MRQIFVDLDGVLADFDAFYFVNYRAILDRDVIDPPGMWDNIEKHGNFYGSLPIMHDAHELWEGVKLFHPNPIILTGIPHSISNAEQQKRDWVSRNIDWRAKVICCASRDKRRFSRPGDILIDDWHKYRHLWTEVGGIFILHTSAKDSLKELESYYESKKDTGVSRHPRADAGHTREEKS